MSECVQKTCKQQCAVKVVCLLTLVAVASAFVPSVGAIDDKQLTNARKTMPVPPNPVAPSATKAVARGQVVKIDKQAGTMTIRHGPLENLHLSATTTVFRVKDSAMLDRVGEHDRVDFSAETVNDIFTITQIERAK